LCAVPLCFTSTERLPLQLLSESTVAVSPALARSAQEFALDGVDGARSGGRTGAQHSANVASKAVDDARIAAHDTEHVCAIPGVRACRISQRQTQ
jgi:hypothetical protein